MKYKEKTLDYLHGRMSAEEAQQFQAAMRTDADLQRHVRTTKNLLVLQQLEQQNQLLTPAELKQQLAARKQRTLYRNLMLAAAILLAIGAYYGFNTTPQPVAPTRQVAPNTTQQPVQPPTAPLPNTNRPIAAQTAPATPTTAKPALTNTDLEIMQQYNQSRQFGLSAPEAQTKLAELWKNKQYHQIIDQYKATKLDEDHDGYLNLAIAYWAIKETDEAKSRLKEIVVAQSDMPYKSRNLAHFYLAKIYLTGNATEQAAAQPHLKALQEAQKEAQQDDPEQTYMGKAFWQAVHQYTKNNKQ